MKIAGVIAEYNPFHNGHAYQLSKIRDMGFTHIVVCMSGNYAQRGSPAVMEKHDRAEIAVMSGADLVIDLPTLRSSASAERFADGGVSLLSALGCVDALCFGTENTSSNEIIQSADVLMSDELQNNIQKHINSGVKYPVARAAAFREITGEDSILSTPNNNLGIEYVIASKKRGFNPEFVTIPRIGAEHNSKDTEGNIASATKIRELLSLGENTDCYTPFPVMDFVDRKIYDRMVLSRLRRLSADEIAQYCRDRDMAMRIGKFISTSKSTDELISLVKAKNFTYSAISRAVLSCFLEITDEDRFAEIPYIKLLAMNEKGREILSLANPALPVITRAADVGRLTYRAKIYYNRECEFTDVYNSILTEIQPRGAEMTNALRRL